MPPLNQRRCFVGKDHKVSCYNVDAPVVIHPNRTMILIENEIFIDSGSIGWN